MGQQTVGILFGIEVPEGLDLYGDDGDEPDHVGVLGRWRKAREQQIQAIYESDKLKPWERAADRVVPATGGSSVYLMGFWVAVGASGMPGVPDMPAALPLVEIETTAPYAAACERARVRWRRFARWAKARGIKLPRARLMLAECEVA